MGELSGEEVYESSDEDRRGSRASVLSRGPFTHERCMHACTDSEHAGRILCCNSGTTAPTCSHPTRIAPTKCKQRAVAAQASCIMALLKKLVVSAAVLLSAADARASPFLTQCASLATLLAENTSPL